jgi:hypothetical protein
MPTEPNPNIPVEPDTARPVNPNSARNALIVGIAAILTALIPYLGLVVGAAAVALNIIALHRKQAKTFAVTGLVLGSIATVFALGATISFDGITALTTIGLGVIFVVVLAVIPAIAARNKAAKN